MAAREKMFPSSIKISFEGPKSLRKKVRAYAKAKGTYLGIAYQELILAGLEVKQKETQLELPLCKPDE